MAHTLSFRTDKDEPGVLMCQQVWPVKQISLHIRREEGSASSRGHPRRAGEGAVLVVKSARQYFRGQKPHSSGPDLKIIATSVSRF